MAHVGPQRHRGGGEPGNYILEYKLFCAETLHRLLGGGGFLLSRFQARKADN